MTFLVDPFKQTVDLVELDEIHTEDEFLDAVRREIGAPQLTVMPIGNGNFAIWLDNMGYLKPNAFWRFSHDPHRYAGKGLITALSPEGYPIAPSATLEEVRAGIVWCPEAKIVRVKEQIAIVPFGDDGRPVPAIVREAIFEGPPIVVEEPEGEESEMGWTVYETEDGRYRALKLRLNADGSLDPTPELLTANNLDELRAKLPAGLKRIEPGAADSPDIVESWVTA
ncbi:MAG: hypothetical protein ABWY78_04970 [Microvirga sp.]